MQFTKILLVFSLFFISACNFSQDKDKIANLEKEMKSLREDLKKAQDPATIDAIQKKLGEAARQKLAEMKNQRSEALVDIESTSDKESCDAVKARIEQFNKDIEQHIVENSIQALTEAQNPNGECTDKGYVGNFG